MNNTVDSGDDTSRYDPVYVARVKTKLIVQWANLKKIGEDVPESHEDYVFAELKKLGMERYA